MIMATGAGVPDRGALSTAFMPLQVMLQFDEKFIRLRTSA
jgi:hypothetical protein